MSEGGYNKMAWDCEDGKNCFNLKMRPKFHHFADCFPGKGNFTDVDGIIEMRGKVLMLEWKRRANDIPLAQEIMFRRLAKFYGFKVVCVAGDAELMTVTDHRIISPYEVQEEWQPSTFPRVWDIFHGWAQWAEANPHPRLYER
jgi:hypothetical protein